MPTPPVVYVPVELDEAGRPAEVRMLRLGDGRVALLGYSALDRLIDCCGPEQPWALLETAALDELHALKPFDIKLLDVPVPGSVRGLLRADR